MNQGTRKSSQRQELKALQYKEWSIQREIAERSVMKINLTIEWNKFQKGKNEIE